VFFYREYMREGLLVSDHRLNIYNLSKPDGTNDSEPRYYSQYADPAIFAKNRGRTAIDRPSWSVADEWCDTHLVDKKTAIWWRPATNDEAMTISRMREYLRVDPEHINPFTRKKGAPRAYFITRTLEYPNALKETITDIRSARRKEVGMNADGTKQYADIRDDKVRDHLLDTVRYALAMRPALGRKAVVDDLPAGHIRINDYFDESKMIEAQEAVERAKNWAGKGYGY
jgi:hypothetical protein